MNDPAGTVLSITEAAARLGKSDKSIRRMIERGELGAEKVRTATGQEWKISAADVTRLADTAGAVAEPAGQRRTGDGHLPDRDGAIVPEPAGRVPEPAGGPVVLPASHQEMELLQRDVGQIKAFIAGDLAAQLRERLAAIPTRDDLADLADDAAGAAVAGVLALLGEAAAQQRLAGHSGPSVADAAVKLMLTVPEAVALSGLSRGAIDAALKAGALVTHRGPWRGRRIRRADVERWIEAMG